MNYMNTNGGQPKMEHWELWKIDAIADGECENDIGEIVPLWVWNDRQRTGIAFDVQVGSDRADVDGAMCAALPKKIADLGLGEIWVGDCVLELFDQRDGDRPVYAAILEEVADR